MTTLTTNSTTNLKYSKIKDFVKSDYYQKYAQAADILLDIRIEIINYMKTHKLTQVQLAEQMQVDQKQVHRMISGNSNISFSTLQKFCNISGAKIALKW
jgi:DNA-binding Xre family transcriptional regulator